MVATKDLTYIKTPAWRVFSCTGLELMTPRLQARDHNHLATTATLSNENIRYPQDQGHSYRRINDTAAPKLRGPKMYKKKP
ncbi:hypothetical protein TNCV_3355311 [Trichonephila clavipes]|nr:hypothetical protein TNCV_3355311 [Trichonephila clavipes]